MRSPSLTLGTSRSDQSSALDSVEPPRDSFIRAVQCIYDRQSILQLASRISTRGDLSQHHPHQLLCSLECYSVPRLTGNGIRLPVLSTKLQSFYRSDAHWRNPTLESRPRHLSRPRTPVSTEDSLLWLSSHENAHNQASPLLQL
ncbi:hypothetical protein PISL3812_04385 [Talaromyces islandicus]|uniref:Uncharacterized protein n=1 Tax=Talaromyces islandicus TaxID=28573 RepID=A0A0U1LVD9_TALIS|nr:hypothetical protein PISL3812_04385 [Talaromyces islandicus]